MDQLALTSGFLGAKLILRIIGDWMIFKKAGKPGWHCIIPIFNMYQEFDICWKGSRGIIAFILMTILGALGGSGPEGVSEGILIVICLLSIWLIIIQWKDSRRLSWAFGKGSIFGAFMFFFGGLGRLILGLGGVEYQGR